MKTPQFWHSKNFISLALLPLTFLYKFGFFIKKKITKSSQSKIPVICIGNITAGGSGKTPTAIKLGKALLENDINFCYLTRGYKANLPSKNSTYFLPKNANNISPNFGDEPILLNEIAPVMIAKNRQIGHDEIVNHNFQAIIMDDGLQNFQLKTALKILVIDGFVGFGNNLLLPSGPLRQSLSSIASQINFFLIIGDRNQKIIDEINLLVSNPQIIFAQVIIKNLADFSNKKFVAFCGIAYPIKFFQLLKNNNLDIVSEISFSDHHNYQESEINKLLDLAKQKNCHLITTKKDWVKFSKIQQQQIKYLDIELEIDNLNCIIDEVKKLINHAK
jgi:tetraacyldisaccharide 4'-kinase